PLSCRLRPTPSGENIGMRETALKSLVATSVAVAVVAIALALWHLKVLVALLLLAIVISAAVRPGVEWMRGKGIPRGFGVAITYGRTALEILVGVFFTFAVAAYWIFEKRRAQALVLVLAKPDNRTVIRETWDLIDAKLGAFVRGQLVMITFVSSVLSFAFWLDGLPYWLLLGVFAGIVEIVPVIGPLAAGVVAIGAGFTVDWQTAAGAAIAVFGLRLAQD